MDINPREQLAGIDMKQAEDGRQPGDKAVLKRRLMGIATEIGAAVVPGVTSDHSWLQDDETDPPT